MGKKPEDEITKILKPGDVDSFSFIVNHVIGNEKLKTNVFLPSMVGTGVRPSQEIMLTKAFESCPFKAVASAVVGKYIIKI